jgi:hypothetical protein
MASMAVGSSVGSRKSCKKAKLGSTRKLLFLEIRAAATGLGGNEQQLVHS